MYVALLRGGNNVPSSAAVNFSQTQYRRRWSTFWRWNIGTAAEKPGIGVVWNVWNIRNVPYVWFVILLKFFVQSVVFVFFNQNAECLTKSVLSDILIIDARDRRCANGKCWTWQRGTHYIYNVYARCGQSKS